MQTRLILLPRIDTDETRMSTCLRVDPDSGQAFLHKETTEKIIGAAFEVHGQLGYGFLGARLPARATSGIARRGVPQKSNSEFRFSTRASWSAITTPI